MRYCLCDRSGHYRDLVLKPCTQRQTFFETMDQVIDEPDECVLSTDQLTLMRLWLLQAKYFPLLIFSHACFSHLPPLLFPVSLSPHILRWKSLVIIVAAGSSLCMLQNREIFILWDMGMIRRSLGACGER